MSEPWTTDNTPARINKLLKVLNRSQVELATLLMVAPATVNRWCKGHYCPDRRMQSTLEKLERHYLKGDSQ